MLYAVRLNAALSYSPQPAVLIMLVLRPLISFGGIRVIDLPFWTVIVLATSFGLFHVEANEWLYTKQKIRHNKIFFIMSK